MNNNDVLAFDASTRSKDANGFLTVTSSNISKAVVNPYKGDSIPNWKELGLQPDKIYMLYRDPEELKKAAHTFNEKPLLRIHTPVDANDVPKESIIGTTGSNAYFEYPYLKNSLTVWDAEDIALIEEDKKKGLSCSYRYRADMTSGEIDGVHFDGVMRDIDGNHVAVVERGRAGSDVLVSDSDIKLTVKEIKNMAIADIKKAFSRIFAHDAKDEEIEEFVKTVKAEDEDEEKKKAADEEAKKKAEDEEAEKKKAEDEEAAKKAEESKEKETANDSIDPAVLRQQILQQVQADMRNVQTAQNAVRPHVGEVAMDSADDIYGYALKQMGVSTQGLSGASLKATFDAVSCMKKSVTMANDSQQSSDLFELSGLKRGIN